MPQHPLDISIEADFTNIISFSAFKYTANNSILIPFPSRFTRNQLKKNRVKQRAKSDLQNTDKSLMAEVTALQQELAILKQQKAELESLLKQQEEARKIQLQEMQIEIDLNKLAHQVAEITQTDYFKQLQIEVESLRNSDC